MDTISNSEAEQLLRRALKCLSAKYRTDIEFRTNHPLNGEIYLHQPNHSHTIIVNSLDGIEITFESTSNLLHTLLMLTTTFEINARQSNYREKWIVINFSKEFGTSVDELKVNLDLLNA